MYSNDTPLAQNENEAFGYDGGSEKASGLLQSTPRTVESQFFHGAPVRTETMKHY